MSSSASGRSGRATKSSGSSVFGRDSQSAGSPGRDPDAMSETRSSRTARSVGSDTEEAFQQNLAEYGVVLLHGDAPEGTATKLTDAVCLQGKEAPSETFMRRLNFLSSDLQRGLASAIGYILSTCKALVAEGHSDPLCRYYVQPWAGMGSELEMTEPGKAMLLFVFCHCLRDAADVWLWDDDEQGDVKV